ncbi:MAG: gliding motility-associated ABC transporter substrate-binding protein GldG [Cyclobacteriaceae bacterium]|nr:gliding motility-associated ABC transporter substrate-binding protein GldG [Cyclobacteriaceae bacterium]
MKISTKKSYPVLVLIAGILAILFANQLAHRYLTVIDLTEEKRFTLHPATKAILSRLESPVTIEVYLEGELPANFKRFQNEIRRTLELFSLYAGNNLHYRFSDPSVAGSSQARNQFYRSLIEKGLQPSNVAYTKNGQKSEKLIFPGAIMSFQDQEAGISLLKSNRAISIDEMLNQSVEGLEYELIHAIERLKSPGRKKIGLVTGHGEPDSTQLAGFTNAILQSYDLYRINLPERRTLLSGYDVIVLSKPTERFSEMEKYLLDQYVMRGGKLMVFLDALSVNMSEAGGEGTVAIPYTTNLEDLLFRYGIRLNQNFVVDVNCGSTPVYTGSVGDQPRIELLPWPYFPIISRYGNHPLVSQLDATYFQFASTMDTVKATGIRKTPLFLTSEYTKVLAPPVKVSYNDLQDNLRPEAFTSGIFMLGVLLEGKFTSLYRNRFPPPGTDRSTFIENGTDAQVIVVSDGDFIRNDFHLETEKPLPMGMDPYSQTTYANEDFLINALNYLTDEDGLMLARNKEVKIRPLDKARVKQEANFWRWLNVALPLLLILVFGSLKYLARTKRYARHAN